MTDQTLSANLNTPKTHPFGLRLRSAREAMGMDRKEVALELRLQEKMIIMIETGEYRTDIPMTFIRGYIRSYSKLLGIPEKEVLEAMELLNPKPLVNQAEKPATPAYVTVQSPMSSIEDQFMPRQFASIFKPLFTFILALTLIALLSVWWQSHKSTPHNIQTDTTTLTQTPIPAGETAPVKTEAPKPLIKANKADTSSFIQVIAINHNIAYLLYLFMFLLIIKISMRFYSAAPIMADIKNARIKHYSKSSLNNTISKLPLKSLIQASLIIIAVLTTGLIANSWLNQAKPKPLAVARPQVNKPVEVTEQKTEAQALDLSPLTGELVQTATFNALLLSGIKPYLLQMMQLQLDDYINQAGTSYFELTDKSTPIGQFKGKKRRRHRVYTSPNPSYENNSADAPPPYYYPR